MNTLSYKRLAGMFQKHFLENQKVFLTALGVMFASLFFGLYILNSSPEVWSAEIYFWGAASVWIFWLGFTAYLAIRGIASPKRRILGFTLPVSRTERMTFLALRSPILATLEFLVALWIVTTLNNLTPQSVHLDYSFFLSNILYNSLLMALITPAVIFGSSLKTNQLILVIVVINFFVMSWEFGGVTFNSLLPVSHNSVTLHDDPNVTLTIGNWGFSWVIYHLWMWGVIVYLWCYTGFRLKEYETR